MARSQIEYVCVKIPKNLADLVDKCIGTRGFSSRADVVNEAIRRFLENEEA